MPKSSSPRTTSSSPRVHKSQTLLKSAPHHFYPNFPFLLENLFGKHISQSNPKCLDSLLTHWCLITCILLISERKSSNKIKRNSVKNQKQFLKSVLHFSNLHEILLIWKKKYQCDSSNILEVIDSEKCSCLNAKKLLFQNTLQESTCSRLPKTVPVCAAWFLS